MALPDFSMRQLLEAGIHFGHQTHRWNPKMERYIFGSRSNIHIIDLSQTMPLLHQALVKVREVANLARSGEVRDCRLTRTVPVAHRRHRIARWQDAAVVGESLGPYRIIRADICANCALCYA